MWKMPLGLYLYVRAADEVTAPALNLQAFALHWQRAHARNGAPLPLLSSALQYHRHM